MSLKAGSSKSPTIVCASGYFSAIHRGHIEYLEKSKALGTFLVVIVNNDHQTKLKHNVIFKSIEDRLEVTRSLRCVDMAVVSIDMDRSVCKTLECLRPHIFANGGDALNDNIPEKPTCEKYNITMIDGLGDKIQSSSWILADYCKNVE
jgi:D-beta-D-heptose 7-phosphate kinase/D-beta-D-heptose 1-phosphate adenosyltransferase